MENKINYCGIDVSCDTLDVYYQDIQGQKNYLQVTNSKPGFKKLIKQTGKVVIL